jgi:hypothetical protein
MEKVGLGVGMKVVGKDDAGDEGKDEAHSGEKNEGNGEEKKDVSEETTKLSPVKDESPAMQEIEDEKESSASDESDVPAEVSPREALRLLRMKEEQAIASIGWKPEQVITR